MTKSQKGGDLFEFNLFWPDMGVIHLKLKSDGLNHLLGSVGTIGLMKLCDVCAERFEYLHAKDGGVGDNVEAEQPSQDQDGNSSELSEDSLDYLWEMQNMKSKVNMI